MSNSSISPLPPDPLPFGDDADVRQQKYAAAQPFWGRLIRAAAMLSLAALTHVWLGRVPGERTAPTLATTVAQPGSLAQALTTGASVKAAGATDTQPVENGVTVRTELVPVTAIGFDRPAEGARPIPSAVPQPTGTAGIFAADRRAPTVGTATPIVDRDAGAKDAAAIEPTPHNEKLAPAPQSEPELTPLSASRRPLRELPRAIGASALPARTNNAERIIHAAPIVEPDPREQVTRVLQQYASAYERLDAEAAKEVYPSVNDTALRRAFRQLETQRVTFASCDFTISGSGANARCQGENEYLPRVGPRTVHRVSREWTFDLAKADNGWHIERVTVR